MDRNSWRSSTRSLVGVVGEWPREGATMARSAIPGQALSPHDFGPLLSFCTDGRLPSRSSPSLLRAELAGCASRGLTVPHGESRKSLRPPAVARLSSWPLGSH